MSRPSIFIDGGIHAREWIAPATVLYFINQVITGINLKFRDNTFVYLDIMFSGEVDAIIFIMRQSGKSYSMHAVFWQLCFVDRWR